MTVSTTHLDRIRAIVTAEVKICDMLLEIGRVVVPMEVMEVFHGIRAFAFCFKGGNPRDNSSVLLIMNEEEGIYLLCAR